MSDKSNIIKLIEEEIKYCEEHYGGSENSEDWEKGFIFGMKHVLENIIKEYTFDEERKSFTKYA